MDFLQYSEVVCIGKESESPMDFNGVAHFDFDLEIC